MKIKATLGYFYVILICLLPGLTVAQTPVTIDAYSDTVICGGNSVTLTAVVEGIQNCNFGTEISNAYGTFLQDDEFYGQVVPLGFNFTFYGNTYNQVLISTNNYLSFDLTNNTAGGYSPWTIPGPIPDASQNQVRNAVLGPWQDILPPTQPPPPALGIIKYAIIGVAPNRIFVLDYNTVTMFSCTNLTFTSQIQLFETSNNIETHLTNKPLCTTWNGGLAIHGLHNSTGTIAHTVPGRNATQWTANNDGYRFTPTSPTAYTIAPIGFNPIPITNGVGVVQWYQNGNLVGTGDSLTITPNVTSDYIARFFDPCSGNTYTDTVTVAVTNTFLTTSFDSVDCNGQSNGKAWVIPTGTFIPFDMQWTDLSNGLVLSNTTGVNAPDSLLNVPAGVYLVAVTDSANCVLTDTVQVFEPAEIQIQIIPTHNICFGAPNGVAVASVTGGTTPYSYLWNDPLTQITLTADSLFAGNYIFQVTDFHNCQETSNVTINQPPKMELVTTSISDTCEKSVGVARVDVTGGTPFYSFYWYPDSIDLQIAANAARGVHYVVVTDGNNCTDTAEAVVLNIASPNADFSFISGEDGVLYPEVTFGNLSENSTHYLWNFGDGSQTTNLLNPVHLFPTADSFLVALIAYNDYDCSDTTAKRISFPPYYTLYIPNSFTPNNDGLNDVFTPQGLGFEPQSFEMNIFNRWGQEIFRTRDFANAWDGKDRSGKILGPGVYAYSIVISEWTGFTRKYNGSVTIGK